MEASSVFAPHRDARPEEIYVYYQRFREAERVARGDSSWLNGNSSIVLLRMEDVQAWLRDPRLGREWRRLLPPGEQPPEPEVNSFRDVADHFMLFRDPPDHMRPRSTANMAFTPRHVNKMRAPIERLAHDLLEDMKRQDGPVDFIANFAYPLPVLVIAGILGVPESDFPRFRDWAAVIAAAIDLPVTGLQEFVQRADQTTSELVEYLGWIVAERRKESRDDLISSLIAAEASEGKINEKELISTLILLLVAGHETTVNLIGNGTYALLQHPDQWQALVDDPSLARNATEELLRYDSPVQMTTRMAMEDLEIAGSRVRTGTEVTFVLGSANRDPRAFEAADRLDVQRAVGRIISFGMGIHFCLGAPLARMEGEVAFQTLTREVPHLQLGATQPDWRAGLVLRGLQTLPVSLH
jgi:cytochrome P450